MGSALSSNSLKLRREAKVSDIWRTTEALNQSTCLTVCRPDPTGSRQKRRYWKVGPVLLRNEAQNGALMRNRGDSYPADCRQDPK